MTRPRLYSNENFPLPVVNELRKLGYDVLTIQDEGYAGKALSDEEVLNYAIESGCAVITLNRKHFIHLHNKNFKHKGIIVCTFDPDFNGQARRIHDAIQSFSELSNQLIRINRTVIK